MKFFFIFLWSFDKSEVVGDTSVHQDSGLMFEYVSHYSCGRMSIKYNQLSCLANNNYAMIFLSLAFIVAYVIMTV